MSSQKHYHDPINYLRAADDGATADDLRRIDSSDDLRRLDSDDEGLLVGERHRDYSLDGIPEQDLAALEHAGGKKGDDDHGDDAKKQDDSNEAKKDSSPPPKIPKPERRAYRPQSVGSKPQPPARERPDLGHAWPYRETLSFTRSLVFYGAGSITKEHERACAHIQQARMMRQKFFGGNATVMKNEDLLKDYVNLSFRMGKEGVAEIYHNSIDTETNLIEVPNVEQFSADYHRLVELTSEGAMRSFSFQRLQMLSTSFQMHTTLNSTIEMEEQSNLLGNDFYRVMKVR